MGRLHAGCALARQVVARKARARAAHTPCVGGAVLSGQAGLADYGATGASLEVAKFGRPHRVTHLVRTLRVGQIPSISRADHRKDAFDKLALRVTFVPFLTRIAAEI